MAEFFVEVILKLIFDLLLFYPGAAIRWLFLRKKKTFDELLTDDFSVINSGIAISFLAAIIAFVAVIKHYIN